MDNLIRESTNDLRPKIEPLIPSMALLFLIDTSESVGTNAIRYLNEALSKFKTEATEDKYIKTAWMLLLLSLTNDNIIYSFIVFFNVEHEKLL